MTRLRPSDLALVVLAGSSAVGLGPRDVPIGQRLVDGAFVTILLTAFLALARSVWRSWREAATARRELSRVAGLVPAHEAASSVAQERERLVTEIEGIVRAHLDLVAARVRNLRSDPAPEVVLQRVQSDARVAMTELRRELGLLRNDACPAELNGPGPAHPSGPPRRDFWLALAVGSLALVEHLIEPATEGIVVSGTGLVLALLMALSLVGRTVAPALATAVSAACLLVGSITGQHVPDGLWLPAVYGLLLWQLVVVSTKQSIMAACALVGAVWVSRQVYQPVNLAMNVAVILVVGLTALAHQRGTRRAATARAQSAPQRALLVETTTEAVAAERRRVARDLHDIASHAVSLIAVQ